ncbi:MAG: hypothetical protein LBC92_04480 [Rickettsiales bacterium]|jgi:hypothetical protein|nr:hypothetical protein [Rickettsiales bacterium]
MFNKIEDYLFFRKIKGKFKGPLRKMYTRKITAYSLKIVIMTYKNLSRRYGISPRKVYNCLPLKVKIDPELEGAYGLCSVGMERVGFFKKTKKIQSTIFLNKNDVTTTTFIHEFGHYVRFLIQQVAATRNKKAFEDFVSLTDLVRSRKDVAMKKNDDFFARGNFTVEEEENFAKTWEQYLRDGIAPTKKLQKLFTNFKKAIFQDMYSRNERRKYEFHEDLEVKVTPDRRDFLDRLIIGKKLNKRKFLSVLLEFYIYSLFAFIILKYLLRILEIKI